MALVGAGVVTALVVEPEEGNVSSAVDGGVGGG